MNNRSKMEGARLNISKKFGVFGMYILDAGNGGGFYSVPEAMDIYQDALGLSIKESWYLKILFRYLPNIYPTMKRIAKETGVREAELSAIKKSLVHKGFIRDSGAIGKTEGRMQCELNIMPFFDAVFLCVICDANSSLVKKEINEKARIAFSEWLGNESQSEWRKKLTNFNFVDLPLPIEAAQKFAEARGFTLNWNRIAELQNCEAVEKLENMTIDKTRMLQIKQAISDGINGAFGFMYYGRTYKWLKWLCSVPVTVEEVERLTADYVKKADTPNAKDYMNWISETVNIPNNQKILAERVVENAILEAAY